MSHDPRMDLTLRDMRTPVPPHDERLRLRLGDMVLAASRGTAATINEITDRLSREASAAADQTPLWAWAVAA